jgi:putative hydrolase of the HAD superfamily
MIGNSLKSDVLPLVNIKAHAIHVPFHTTWTHEQVNEEETNGKTYKTVAGLLDILPLLN